MVRILRLFFCLGKYVMSQGGTDERIGPRQEPKFASVGFLFSFFFFHSFQTDSPDIHNLLEPRRNDQRISNMGMIARMRMFNTKRESSQLPRTNYYIFLNYIFSFLLATPQRWWLGVWCFFFLLLFITKSITKSSSVRSN